MKSPSLASFFFALALLCSAILATPRVLFLPFDDRVRLNEAWDLEVDIPRWYAQTVDTIGGVKKIECIPYDSAAAIIENNGWSRSLFMQPQTLARLATLTRADYIVSGTVRTFKVVKRGISSDGLLGAEHQLSGSTSGAGGTPVMAGLHTYSATVRMSADIYNAAAERLQTIELDSESKDGGLTLWMPFQGEHSEMTFYYLSRTPFGSEYFCKSVAGAVMKQFSQTLQNTLLAFNPQQHHVTVVPEAREFVQGKILDRVGNDVYVNLGSDDGLLLGELLEVLKPSKAVLGEQGDTLGWTEQPVGMLKVRSIKSNHFSQATVSQESDSLRSPWTVRLFIQ
jgi:hypothetical protein